MAESLEFRFIYSEESSSSGSSAPTSPGTSAGAPAQPGPVQPGAATRAAESAGRGGPGGGAQPGRARQAAGDVDSPRTPAPSAVAGQASQAVRQLISELERAPILGQFVMAADRLVAPMLVAGRAMDALQKSIEADARRGVTDRPPVQPGQAFAATRHPSQPGSSPVVPPQSGGAQFNPRAVNDFSPRALAVNPGQPHAQFAPVRAIDVNPPRGLNIPQALPIARAVPTAAPIMAGGALAAARAGAAGAGTGAAGGAMASGIMAGGALAAVTGVGIAAGAVVGAFAAVGVAAAALDSKFREMGEGIRPFSLAMSAAAARQRSLDIGFQIQRAGRMGESLAGFTEARGELGRELGELLDRIMKPLVELAMPLIELLTKLVDAVNGPIVEEAIRGMLLPMKNMIEAILAIANFFMPDPPNAAQAPNNQKLKEFLGIGHGLAAAANAPQFNQPQGNAPGPIAPPRPWPFPAPWLIPGIT